MSITSDLRTYADTAVAQSRTVVAQGRQVLDQSLTGATGTVNELRSTAEKAINLDALKTAVEPYLAQAREYGTAVTDRADGVLANLRSDQRVAKVLDSATAVSGVVLEQVNDRIVKPVQSLTGLGAQPSAPVRKPAPKPAATKPATTRTTARKAPASKAPASKTAAPRTPKA
jgi:hypothetical protein